MRGVCFECSVTHYFSSGKNYGISVILVVSFIRRMRPQVQDLGPESGMKQDQYQPSISCCILHHAREKREVMGLQTPIAKRLVKSVR